MPFRREGRFTRAPGAGRRNTESGEAPTDAAAPPARHDEPVRGPPVQPDAPAALDTAVAGLLPAEAVLARLDSGPEGLASGEAAARRARVGPNVLRTRRETALAVLVRQLRNPLLLLLLGAALVSGLTGAPIDALIIATIVLLSVGLGFTSEYRAAGAVAALHADIHYRARVWRDGGPTRGAHRGARARRRHRPGGRRHRARRRAPAGAHPDGVRRVGPHRRVAARRQVGRPRPARRRPPSRRAPTWARSCTRAPAAGWSWRPAWPARSGTSPRACRSGRRRRPSRWACASSRASSRGSRAC